MLSERVGCILPGRECGGQERAALGSSSELLISMITHSSIAVTACCSIGGHTLLR